MIRNLHLFSGKLKYLFGFIFLSFVSLVSLAFSLDSHDDYDDTKREIILRKIGHEILLQSGDSTSRILPIKKISENEYQISVENAFTFQPDELVNTTQRLLSKDPFAKDYIVKVLNCADESLAYGFAISKDKKEDIVGCKKRNQPLGCYLIQIKFKPTDLSSTKSKYLLGGFFLLAFGGFIFMSFGKTKKLSSPFDKTADLQDPQPSLTFTIGETFFDTEARTLMINGNTIDLTKTEARVLGIFASAPNALIERSAIQKEIWEDEGVIVGRSLDMFISKLRKKLELDPNIKIVVIRNKGYKLEINAV